jgi:hypothetical protein
MIYSVYFDKVSGMYASVPRQEALITAIKTSGDFFVFILNNTQMEGRWNTFLAKHGLRGFIQFEFTRPVTNINYPSDGRKLHLFVLSTKKMEGDKYVSGTFCGAV